MSSFLPVNCFVEESPELRKSAGSSAPLTECPPRRRGDGSSGNPAKNGMAVTEPSACSEEPPVAAWRSEGLESFGGGRFTWVGGSNLSVVGICLGIPRVGTVQVGQVGLGWGSGPSGICGGGGANTGRSKAGVFRWVYPSQRNRAAGWRPEWRSFRRYRVRLVKR